MLSHTPRALVAPTEPYPLDRATWEDQVRPGVLATFGEQIYGEKPDGEIDLTWQVREEGEPGKFSRLSKPGRPGKPSRPGKPGRPGKPSDLSTPGTSSHATTGQVRRQIELRLTGPLGEMTLTLLVYLPAVRTAVVPAFLGLNFGGNHTTTTDRRVLRTDLPQQNTGPGAGPARRLRRASRRGSKAGRWPYRLATDRGYAVITAGYLQVGPDHGGIFFRGPHRLFGPAPAGAAAGSGAVGAAGGGPAGEVARTATDAAGADAPGADAAGADLTPAGGDRRLHRWGAIGMWAWVLSRVMDGLKQGMIPEVDPDRVIAMGHSRLGKTALWAAASDERFAAVISNNSGCMGAAASREVGETPEVLARVRPYWFAPAFARQVLGGQPLPVDQHQLLACIAPRPLYVASASEDRGADPEGEFASWHTARQVWGLYDYPAGPVPMPAPGGAVSADGAPLGYHLRAGGHDVTAFDWHHWLDFADRWVAQRPQA